MASNLFKIKCQFLNIMSNLTNKNWRFPFSSFALICLCLLQKTPLFALYHPCYDLSSLPASFLTLGISCSSSQRALIPLEAMFLC